MEQAVLVCTGICASTAVLLWGTVTFYKRGVRAWVKAQRNYVQASHILEGVVKARNDAASLLEQVEALQAKLPSAAVIPFRPRLVTSDGGSAA